MTNLKIGQTWGELIASLMIMGVILTLFVTGLVCIADWIVRYWIIK